MSEDSKGEWQDSLRLVAMAALALESIDIPKMLERIDHADTVAPFFDPTLYMKKVDAMHQDREMLKAALPLWRFGKKIAEARTASRVRPLPGGTDDDQD